MNPKYILLLIALAFAACTTLDAPEIEYGKPVQSNKKLSKILKNDKLYIEIIRDDKERVAEIKEYFENSDEFQTTTYRYNTNNQLVERHYQETLSDYYVYKEKRLVEMRSTNSKNPEWSPRLIYHYDNRNRIAKADKYQGEKKIGYILFEYDENNNTTARKEYLAESSKYVLEEYRFSYTKGINPLQELYLNSADIRQSNNTASSYFHAMYISCLPITIFSEYTYDQDGYPLSKTDTPKSEYLQYPKTIYTFVYQ